MLSSSSTMRMIFLARCPYCKESCAPLFISLSFRKTNTPHSIEFPQTYSNILKLRTEGFPYQYTNFFVFHDVLCSFNLDSFRPSVVQWKGTALRNQCLTNV